MKLYDNDSYRETFMEAVYEILASDSDNYRANAIIDAFDSVPGTTVKADGEISGLTTAEVWSKIKAAYMEGYDDREAGRPRQWNAVPLSLDEITERIGRPVWVEADASPMIRRYDIVTAVTATSIETLRGEYLCPQNCGKTWRMYYRPPMPM